MLVEPGQLLVLLVAFGILVLALRWVYRPSRPRRRADPPPIPGGERGLLRPVGHPGDPAEATALRARLTTAGIRSTTGRDPAGRLELLVFAEDVDRARALLPPP